MAASEGVDLEWNIVQNLGGHVPERINYSSKIKDQGKKCVDSLKKKFGSQKIEAWHSDDRKNPFGTAIYAKPEPKTDIVLKIGSKVYSASVKMAGPVQLASGQGSSTAELFEAAAGKIKNSNKNKVLSSIIEELRTMPTRLLSSSNMDRIVKEAKPAVIDEFIRKGKIIQEKSYEYWLENSKPYLMESLLKFIKNDGDFLRALVREALTGEVSLKKFKGAVADSVISPNGFYVIDDSYVNKVIQNIKFDVRGKSRSGITGLAFRIDVKM